MSCRAGCLPLRGGGGDGGVRSNGYDDEDD